MNADQNVLEADEWAVEACSGGIQVELIHECGCCSTIAKLDAEMADQMIAHLRFAMRHSRAICAGQSVVEEGNG
jgi:hypothetical protein